MEAAEQGSHPRPLTNVATVERSLETDERNDAIHGRAETMAEMLCEGFRFHDERKRAESIEAFYYVDRRQFDGVSDEDAWDAAEAYVDALWRKDEVEEPYVSDGRIVDPDGLAEADWSPVRDALARRARAVGFDESYAELTTESWRRHKVGGDYWTPMLRAQEIECSAALGEQRPSHSEDTPRETVGHLPARYLVGVELHDLHTEAHWRQAIGVMTPYFETILRSADSGRLR